MIIKIKNLKVHTIIGVYSHEKKADRELIFNVEIKTGKYKTVTDKLTDTLDYDGVVDFIKQETRKSRYDLIETLANKLVDALSKFDGIEHIRMEIDKPGCIEDMESVSVTVESK